MRDDVEVTVTLPAKTADYLRRFWAAKDPSVFLDTEPGWVCILLAAALPPPKTDEPTLLGTVVATAHGPVVLADRSARPWWRAQDMTWARWADLRDPRPASAADVEGWSR